MYDAWFEVCEPDPLAIGVGVGSGCGCAGGVVLRPQIATSDWDPVNRGQGTALTVETACLTRERRPRIAKNYQDVATVTTESILESILLLRGHKVMLSMHLASLYGVEFKVLVQTVKINLEKSPSDFIFQRTNQELGMPKHMKVAVA